MKKVSLLIAMIAFVFGNAFAQFSYDFNDGTAGAKIAQTYGTPWTTWSNAPGGAEDGVFAEVNGDMAAHFTYNNDQVVLFGAQTSGAWGISFDMYIPNGKDAYNNVLHAFNGSGSEWATEVYYKHSENGTMIAAGGQQINFTCPFDAWFNVRYAIDLDNDLATFYIDDVEVVTWQYSLQADGSAGVRQLDAADFFPPTSTAVSDYYIDNFEFTSNSGGDEVIIDDDFEAYTVGNKIAVEAQAAGNDWWTTWSNNPGSAEDGVVATQDTKTGHFTWGNDQVLLLGDAESSQYTVSFDMYIPNGKDAYNNVLHAFAGSGSEWGVEVNYKKSDGTNIEAAGVTTNFDCPYDAWFNVRYEIDLDNDLATFYVDDAEIVSWQFSLKTDGTQGQRKLAAIDFYPPTGSNSEYYIDNVLVVKHGGASAPHLAIAPEAITETLAEDEMTTVDITITNSGNSIGDWMAYLDFGQGGTGSQTANLYYHDGAEGSNIGSSSAVTREMGVRFPASAYGNAAMGMKAISAQYFIGTNYQSADHVYIFRLYAQGMGGQPGEMLAEKSVTSTAAGQWITATFDESVYMTGQDMWVTVQLEQNASEYPLTMDGGEYGEVQDGNWLSTNGGSFSHCYSAGSFGGAWLITLNCQGEKIPGGWALLSATDGSIMGGQSQTVTLTLNSIAMENGTYTAGLTFITNDPALPTVEIPVTLVVSPESIIETSANTVSVYPNPTTGTVNVEGENIAAIAIYSAAGQLINVVNTTAVDMSVYGAGVYFFNIIDNANNSTITRVVVK